MILFKLKCTSDHEFEGWFRDNAAYDRQHTRGQIVCPDCGSIKVEKALMAPRLGRSRSETAQDAAREVARETARLEAAKTETTPNVPAVPQGQPDSPPSPAQLRRALQELRRHVEAHCDYVGPGFVEEARRIHRGEAEARGIYGEATSAESEALADEGIEIAAIPWIPPNDA